MATEKVPCFTEFMKDMAADDAGAKEVFNVMLSTDGPRTVRALNILEDHDIRGEKIWNLFVASECQVSTFFDRIDALERERK